MPKNVEIPSLGVVEFPDSMTESQIAAQVQAMMPPARAGVAFSPATSLAMQAGADPRAVLGRVAGLAPIALSLGLTGVGGAVAGVPGAMAGSGLAEAASQAMKLTEPSLTNLGFAIAAPRLGQLAGRGIERVLRFGARRLPGAAAMLHEQARDRLASLSSVFGPTKSSEQLYGLVNQFDPQIALPTLKASVKTLLSKEAAAASGLKLPGVVQTATELAGRVTPTTKQVATGILDPRGRMVTRSVTKGADTMSFQDIRVNLRRIGDKIRETRITGGEEHGAWKKLFKSLMDDMESAAAQGNTAQPAVQVLKQANAAARREFVQEELADILTKTGMRARPDIGEGFVQINFGAMREALRTGKHAADIAMVLKPEEMKLLTGEITRLAKATPNLPPPRGQFAGSAVVLGRAALGGGLGFLAGQTMGRPELGAAAGTVLATKGVEMLARLVMSDGGRQLLGRVVLSSPGGILSPTGMMLLGAAASQLPAVRGGAVTLSDFAQEVVRP